MVITHSHRSFAHAGLLALAIAVAGCVGPPEEPTPPPPSPTSVKPSVAASAAPPSASADSGEGMETSVFELEVGDCFSVESDELVTVAVVDCEASHEFEVFAVFDHEAGPDEPYPGDDAVVEYADTACQPPFEEFVGHDYQTSIWYITALTPSAETWADGDREIACALNQRDEHQEPISVTGSAEGANE